MDSNPTRHPVGRRASLRRTGRREGFCRPPCRARLRASGSIQPPATPGLPEAGSISLLQTSRRPRLERHARPHLRRGARPACHAARHAREREGRHRRERRLRRAREPSARRSRHTPGLQHACEPARLTISADDDLGRERLCRYGPRPPFSLSRLRVLRDGRVSYRAKKSSRRVSRCRMMTPVECIARLCALVPPPRYPLTRFHGVLAPRVKLRPRVVPKLPKSAGRVCASAPSRPPDQREAQGQTAERPPPPLPSP